MAEESAAIALNGVSKIYGTAPERGLDLLRAGADRQEMVRNGYVVAVDNAQLSILPGEIFVVMGLSGSGKSTLLRCINRLVEPTAGRILIEGKNITHLETAVLLRLRVEKLGMVFQQFALFPHLTVLDNIAFGLRVRGMPKRRRRARAAEILSLVGLEGWGDKKPRQLSGGMQQRVGLARALALDPPILLMDEPFGSLDPLIREEMQRELLRLQKTLRKTVVFITHDLNEAITLGSRVAIFREGRIVQLGAPLDIIARPHDDYVSAFVRDVNPLKILTFDQALDRAVPVLRADKADAAGAIAAVGAGAGCQHTIVLDADGRALGITLQSGTKTADNGSLGHAMARDFLRVPFNAPIGQHLSELAAATLPAIVVDGDGRFVGALTSQSIVQAISARRAPTGPGEECRHPPSGDREQRRDD